MAKEGASRRGKRKKEQLIIRKRGKAEKSIKDNFREKRKKERGTSSSTTKKSSGRRAMGEALPRGEGRSPGVCCVFLIQKDPEGKA